MLVVCGRCIPVFIIPDGHYTLEELIPWHRVSLKVGVDDISRLPHILRSVPNGEVARMQSELVCVRPLLWFASVYGSCDRAVATRQDAFDAIMEILRQRMFPGTAQYQVTGTAPASQMKLMC